jgi:hypothetical protein
MSVFYVGESTLLHFNSSKIVGGIFNNYPGNIDNKLGYILLMREKIKDTYIDNQLSLEDILSTKISFSKNTSKFLDEYQLDTLYILNDGSTDYLESDMFTTLIQYNGAFYNLAFSPLDLEQNHTDILNFIYNSFNDYSKGINLLISAYIHELNVTSKSIYLYWGISLAIYLIIYVVNYIIIIHYYIIGNNKRTSFLEVFYELNENVLKILITNCENLFKKLKETELKVNEDETENMDDNIDKKVYFMFKEKQARRNSLFLGKKSENIINNQKNFKNKLPIQIKNFMKFFGFCLIITFAYFIFNTIYFINLISEAKYISDYLYKS